MTNNYYPLREILIYNHTDIVYGIISREVTWSVQKYG